MARLHPDTHGTTPSFFAAFARFAFNVVLRWY